MNANVAKCLLVSKVLVADGMMSDDEKQFLGNMMQKLGLTPEEQRRVIDLEDWDAAEAALSARDGDRAARVQGARAQGVTVVPPELLA
jgi:uncharacterized tellurite resistance protein B-like protein